LRVAADTKKKAGKKGVVTLAWRGQVNQFEGGVQQAEELRGERADLSARFPLIPWSVQRKGIICSLLQRG